MAEKVIDSTQRVITLENRAEKVRVFINEIREFFTIWILFSLP